MPTILVIEDNLAVRTLLGFALRGIGCHVLFAADAETALARYQKGISLVLLDLEMPGLDSAQTCRALRQIDPDVRCCFLTGHAGSRAAPAGALAVLVKPLVSTERFSRELYRLALQACGVP